MVRLHLLFITSWLYFSSKFQDGGDDGGVQSAKKDPPYVCVCERESATVILLYSTFTLWHNRPDSVSPLQKGLPISGSI